MKTITVLAEDRIGLLADISYILGKSNINIESLTVDIVGTNAVIALTIKDYKKANSVLESNGFRIAEMDSIVIKLPNRPEALSSVADKLAGEKININDMHILSGDSHTGIFAISVDKPRKAMKLLGSVLITPEENYVL